MGYQKSLDGVLSRHQINPPRVALGRLAEGYPWPTWTMQCKSLVKTSVNGFI